MAGPRDGFVSVGAAPDAFGAEPARPPAFAGLFYPDDAEQCQSMARSYLAPVATSAARPWRGGIVPHAGWMYSGAVAGEAIATLAQSTPADVVVIFGAIHTRRGGEVGALDSNARWLLPGGQAPVAGELRHRLAEQASAFAVDDRYHWREHAVEVELPMVALAWPGVPIVPVEVPAIDQAVQIGQIAAQTIAAAGLNPVFLASSDLTHYGPDYALAPAGVGEAGLAWAKDNDRRLLDLVVAGDAEAVVPHVRQHTNACGAGAIAAMLAACREFGAVGGQVLRHTNSSEVAARRLLSRSDNAVGYAGVVVG